MLVSVIGLTIPNVIRNITENTNQLSFQILTSSGTSVLIYTITIPPGIYSAWSFRDYINGQTVAPANSIQCLYDEKNFKFSFVSTFRFRVFNNDLRPTTCGALIGVGKNSNNEYEYPINYTTPDYTVIMPSTVNFIPTPYIFLKINNFLLSNINSQGVINNTLLRIPVNANYGEIINYRPAEVNKFIVNRNTVNEVEISLQDNLNNSLEIDSAVELQIILKFEYINIPEAPQHDIGTIQHYFKENPIKPVKTGDESLGDV
tara:strand:+ start:2306 stop:3085 length:780 start_codon:yes stop_codon:yes gene_type:complete